MKRILLSVLTAAGLFSCSEDKLDIYDGQDSVYFNVAREGRKQDSHDLADTTRFSFVDRVIDDTLISLRVSVLGNVVPQERKFYAEIIPESTTGKEGVDFKMEKTEFVVPADSVFGYVQVLLFRTSVLLDTSYQIGFRLKSSEDFSLALEKQVLNKENNKYVDLLNHYLVFSDHLDKPLRWDSGNLLGVWTVKKHLLINKLLDMDSEKWAAITPGKMSAISAYMRSYLQEHIDQGIEFAIREDDGSFMVVKDVKIPEGWE